MVGVLMSDEQIKILESLSDEELLDLHRNVKMTLDMLEKEGYTLLRIGSSRKQFRRLQQSNIQI